MGNHPQMAARFRLVTYYNLIYPETVVMFFFCVYLFLFDDGVGWDVNVHVHVALMMLR